MRTNFIFPVQFHTLKFPYFLLFDKPAAGLNVKPAAVWRLIDLFLVYFSCIMPDDKTHSLWQLFNAIELLRGIGVDRIGDAEIAGGVKRVRSHRDPVWREQVGADLHIVSAIRGSTAPAEDQVAARNRRADNHGTGTWRTHHTNIAGAAQI